MRIALLQITTNADKMANFEHLRQAAEYAAKKGARVLVFPEATSQAFGTGRLDKQAENLDGEFATAVRELASELGVVIVAGMFVPADTVEKEGKKIDRVHNTALITGAGLHQGYRKIHTYDAFGYRESDTVKPGEELMLFEVDGVSFGVAICYDIRFPEQFKQLAREGAHIIVVLGKMVRGRWSNGRYSAVLVPWIPPPGSLHAIRPVPRKSAKAQPGLAIPWW